MAHDATDLSRRAFLRAGAAAGGGLLLHVAFGSAPAAAQASSAMGATFEPNAFVLVGPDGKVTITMPYIEMGQGTYTSVPMLVAEELELGLDQVVLRHAPASDKLYANPLLGSQMTGGSTTMRGAWLPLRQAGAAARMMLVEAAAQGWQVPAADCVAEHGEVIHRASGRRARYGDLADAAARIAVPQKVALKAPADFRLVGTPARRLDTPLKVNGSALYGIDARVPGMKFAALAQSPVFGGRLHSVDEKAALRLKGVRQVVRLDDCVAVIADHTGAARKGLAALKIRWDDGANAKLATQDIRAGLRSAADGSAAVVRKEGDVAAQQGKRVTAVYDQPFLIHAAMEPMNCTVHVRPDGCDVWVGTQVMTRAQATAATVTGLPLEKVTVHNHYLGGSFGRRLEVDNVTRAVQIAQHVKAPVKVIWSREEDVQHDVYRGPFHDRLAATLDAQGLPVAWTHRITGPSTLKRYLPPAYNNGFDHEVTEGAAQPPYALPNLLVEYVNHEPPVPTGFWRGVGPAHNVFVVESFIDELAGHAGRDPVEYRAALLQHNPRALAVLRLAADKAGWGGALPARTGRGVSVQFAFGTYLALVTEAAVADDGSIAVRRVTAAVDPGIAVNPDTIAAQIDSAVIFSISAALYGEATLANGRIEQSNFHDVRVLRINEVPHIDTHIVASSEAPGGMGEPGTAAMFPSLANAVHAATGTRLRSLPLDAGLLKRA